MADEKAEHLKYSKDPQTAAITLIGLSSELQVHRLQQTPCSPLLAVILNFGYKYRSEMS